ncbi:latexin isoform X1 [Onychostruthus taczanowskii]|uniref:latexin isoform X1 n=1 Tax=Onychostruthus taczanowskii TaxID=356909 RepID=UPI001B7FFA94|nr:latexin isoform X1 [Onychostruthus taczanowskii]
MRCPRSTRPGSPPRQLRPRPALPAGGGSGSRAMELPPSHFPAARAAAVAVGYLRYLRGGPGRGLQLRELRRARRQDIDDVGHKYYLELELEDVLDKDRTVNCTAEVLYHLGSKTSAPDVQVTVQGELRSTEEADKEFYNRIRSLEKELVAENIPDSHGNVPPELEPIHLLAWVASGYVIWQNSTENTKFHLAQVKHVKQVVSYQQEQNPRLGWDGGTLKLIPFPLCMGRDTFHSPGCSKPIQPGLGFPWKVFMS